MIPEHVSLNFNDSPASVRAASKASMIHLAAMKVDHLGVNLDSMRGSMKVAVMDCC